MATSNSETAPSVSLDAPFENHLAFMAAHRGEVSRCEDSVRVRGLAPFLSSWTPLRSTAPLPGDRTAVRLIPQSGRGWERGLKSAGYAPAETLAYMMLEPRSLAQLRPADAPLIIRVADETSATAFAQVQAAAFLTDDSPHRDWWISCFQRMAVLNYRRSGQTFFIAAREGLPAAVLLLLHAAGVSGIYAVATDPRFQRKGLSTALLHAAATEAVARGSAQMVLQAVSGSYADGFYRRLGFANLFSSTVWRVVGPECAGGAARLTTARE